MAVEGRRDNGECVQSIILKNRRILRRNPHALDISSKDVTPLNWQLVALALLCSAVHSSVDLRFFTNIRLTAVEVVSSFTTGTLALLETSSC